MSRSTRGKKTKVIEWQGRESITNRQLQNEKHYEAFSMGGATYKLHDCVLVSNDINSSLEEAKVCQLVDLYDTSKEKLAKVRHYKRYQSLPESTQRKLPSKPNNNEVFLSIDRRDRDPIDLSQVLGKCQVLSGQIVHAEFTGQQGLRCHFISLPSKRPTELEATSPK